MSNKKLGYSKDNVLTMPMDNKMSDDFEKIKGELLRDQNVLNVSAGSDSPVEVVGGYSIRVEGMNEDNSLGINAVTVDKDFVNTMGMELVAGTDFTDSDVELSTLKS